MIFFWALYHLLSYQLDSWEISTLVLFVIWLKTVLNSCGLSACSSFIHLLISSSLLLFGLLSCVPTLHSHGLRHARLPCPLLSPRVCSNSCPLNRWCHPTISSSVAPFSSCPQSFPASGSFPVSRSGRVDSLELSIVFSGEVTWNPPYWEKEVRFALRALEDSI